MRITIDTELQVIIVPDSYYMQVDKLNEIITSAGGNKLDYKEYMLERKPILIIPLIHKRK